MDTPILEQVRERFEHVVVQGSLLDAEIRVLVKALTTEEAIGAPGRRDFPIILGKEGVIEADFAGTRAHAFTDSPKEFIGKLRDVLNLPVDSNSHRAIFVGVLNAALRYLLRLKKRFTAKMKSRKNVPLKLPPF